MKRKFSEHLNNWYDSGAKAPLLVIGPRGVGKTYSVLQMASAKAEKRAYINFETDHRAKVFFEQLFERSGSFEAGIREYLGLGDDEKAPGILLIFDEIQACRGMQDHLSELGTSFRTVLISSFVSADIDAAYDKGLIELVKMHPLDFEEFLCGTGKEWYSEIILGHYEKKKPVPGLVHNEIMEMFTDYLRIGGMPGAVNEYIREDGIEEIESIQRQILTGILRDFADYAHPTQAEDILITAARIIALGRLRFTFNLIRRGATLNMYSNTLDVLEKNGIITKCPRVDKPDDFRLSVFDSGILMCLIKSIETVEEDEMYRNILCNLVTEDLSRKHSVFYYEDPSRCKVNILYRIKNDLIPVETGFLNSRRSRSIKKYCSERGSQHIVYVGENNYNFMESETKMPAYGYFLLV